MDIQIAEMFFIIIFVALNVLSISVIKLPLMEIVLGLITAVGVSTMDISFLWGYLAVLMLSIASIIDGIRRAS